MSSVANPSECIDSATYLFLGLCLLLPLPCAKTTIPSAASGSVSVPSREKGPTGICTICSGKVCSVDIGMNLTCSPC
jgi:hypothetical protein